MIGDDDMIVSVIFLSKQDEQQVVVRQQWVACREIVGSVSVDFQRQVVDVHGQPEEIVGGFLTATDLQMTRVQPAETEWWNGLSPVMQEVVGREVHEKMQEDNEEKYENDAKILENGGVKQARSAGR